MPITAHKPLVLVAAAILLDDQHRLLLNQRPPHKSWAGYWEFPGGKLEAGESPEQALMRELQEELGIEVVASDLQPFQFVSHAYDDFHLLMPLYTCHQWQGSIVAREDQPIAWVDVEKLLHLKLLPADQALLPDLLAYVAAHVA